MRIRYITILFATALLVGCNTPSVVLTSGQSPELKISVAEVENLGDSYIKGDYRYSTTNPDLEYVRYTIVFENLTAEPVVVSTQSLIVSPIFETQEDGESKKVVPLPQRDEACCSFAETWAEIKYGFQVAFGTASTRHFREIEPGGRVAIRAVYFVPAGKSYNKLTYKLTPELLKGLQEMEASPHFGSPEVPYLVTEVSVDLPQK